MLFPPVVSAWRRICRPVPEHHYPVSVLHPFLRSEFRQFAVNIAGVELEESRFLIGFVGTSRLDVSFVFQALADEVRTLITCIIGG